jgi:hypothetical protein
MAKNESKQPNGAAQTPPAETPETAKTAGAAATPPAGTNKETFLNSDKDETPDPGVTPDLSLEDGAGAAGEGGDSAARDGEEEKTAVTLRHKTEYPLYRRAGLVLKQTPAEFEVTAEQLAVLKKDRWVEFVSGGKTK